jgi:hypothetical protein
MLMYEYVLLHNANVVYTHYIKKKQSFEIFIFSKKPVILFYFYLYIYIHLNETIYLF